MCRNIDQRDYEPIVGLLFNDGRVVPEMLDVSRDKFIDARDAESLLQKALDMTDFVEQLGGLATSAVEFIDVLKKFMAKNKLDRRVKRLVLEAAEKAKEVK